MLQTGWIETLSPCLFGFVRRLSRSIAWLATGAANLLLSMISFETRDGTGRAGYVGVRSARRRLRREQRCRP
jgi:hypothetical protein